MKKIFLGNLPFEVTQEDLDAMMTSMSCPITVDMPRDRKTGKARGFAFAEIQDDDLVEECIEKLKHTKLKGRNLRVDEVHEKGKGGGGAGRRDEEHNER
jgi:RNA recognition motif-containing protein